MTIKARNIEGIKVSLQKGKIYSVFMPKNGGPIEINSHDDSGSLEVVLTLTLDPNIRSDFYKSFPAGEAW